VGGRTCTRRRALAGFAGFIALTAYYGAIGMVTHLLPVEPSLVHRLPFDSLVFAGLALAVIVALPTTATAVLAWRGHPRSGDVATLAGVALVGWIAVELAVVQQLSPLQAICAAEGAALVMLGSREMLREVADVALAAPLFLVGPLSRPWHLRWGATREEAAAPMPGDALVPRSHFTATRAITVDAAPEAVWPWLMQVGFGRAGFYSYDLLDNLGRPSARTIMPRWQHLAPGDLAAPMANPATPSTSFVVAELDEPMTLVWAKPDSTWCWSLRRLSDGRTRVVTRLRQRYGFRSGALLTVVLAELGDFPMMRKMLLGIKRRAEAGSLPRPSAKAA
jgi:hypothetical protein